MQEGGADVNTKTNASFTFDQHVLTWLIVVICALPFLLGDQQMSLTSVEESGVNSTEGDVVKQIVLVGLYAASALLLVKRVRISQGLAALGAPLLMLLALSLLSVAWAELPSVVLRRSVALVGTFAVGLYAGMRLDERQVLRVVIRSTWIVLLASFAVAAVFPAAGLDPEGRFRGVLAHKNGMGAIAALGLLAVASSLYDPQRPRAPLTQLGFVAVCILSLVLSDSASPIPVLAFGIVALIVAHASSPRSLAPSLLLITTLAVGILVPLFAADLGAIAALLGRDPDFSGRTHVWVFSLELLQRRLVFGWGFGGFWHGEAGMAFLRWAYYPVVHAHNGFLQLALDIGLAGLLLFASALLTFTSRARELLKTDPAYGYGLTFAYAAFFLAANISETRLLVGNQPFTMLFVFIIVRANLRSRQRSTSTVGDRSAPIPAQRDQ